MYKRMTHLSAYVIKYDGLKMTRVSEQLATQYNS
jgi:hypothetical protein